MTLAIVALALAVCSCCCQCLVLASFIGLCHVQVWCVVCEVAFRMSKRPHRPPSSIFSPTLNSRMTLVHHTHRWQANSNTTTTTRWRSTTRTTKGPLNWWHYRCRPPPFHPTNRRHPHPQHPQPKTRRREQTSHFQAAARAPAPPPAAMSSPSPSSLAFWAQVRVCVKVLTSRLSNSHVNLPTPLPPFHISRQDDPAQLHPHPTPRETHRRD